MRRIKLLLKPKTASNLSATKKAVELTENKSLTDVNGSYTGKPLNEYEIPEQDADDL